MTVSEDEVEFIIRDRIKTTRRVLKLTVITWVASDNETLNVADHVKMFIECTKEFRKNDGKLFLSWATKNPVVKQSIFRWLVEVLKLSGIDTTTHKAHSYIVG